jgi:hypothetical protein
MSTAPSSSRRHDLDALRAAAMLLGLAFHAALSFAAGASWLVQDTSQSRGMYLFQAATHGFRMPLFFLLSGFFTAMMWRKSGLKALLLHRFRRIFLPCLLGLLTVVPATNWVAGKAMESGARKIATEAVQPVVANDLASAALAGDVAAVARMLAAGADPNQVHAQWTTTPLTMTALRGDTNMAIQLIDGGAKVQCRNGDGGTALHAAALLGRTGVADVLLARGADVRARTYSGETPINSAEADWAITAYIADLFQIPLDRGQIESGRVQIIRQLESLGGDRMAPAGDFERLARGLIDTKVFGLIWFLWFLCWLVAGFAVYARIAGPCGWKFARPGWLLSPTILLLVVPFTMIPQWFIGRGGFGPDTSMGILPAPQVLLYYAPFFGFGVLYFDCDDEVGMLGRRWRWSLSATLLILFPLALEFATGTFGFRQLLLPERFHHLASVALQALYTWLMAFACMGMFRSLLTRESRTLRYLSDAAYWLYLAHLPLVIWAQMMIRDWRLPAMVKCTLMTLAVTGFLLLIYDKWVRYTWVGRMLNGSRNPPSDSVADESSSTRLQ